jgi:AcrR family transcriptional regulator
VLERIAVSEHQPAERAAETRETLIAAARPLFAEHGFAAVADKTELFAAVFEQVEAEVAARMGEAIAASNETDPVEVMRLGAAFWLDACSDPEIQRIVLVDAPGVLGWTRWTAAHRRSTAVRHRG